MDQKVWLPEEHGYRAKLEGRPFVVLRTHDDMCPCCGQHHKILTIVITDDETVAGGHFSYTAVHDYCAQSGELFSTPDMASLNATSMELAYINHAGTPPLPECVKTELKSKMQDMINGAQN